MTHQILIASYTKDFPWLKQCLRSLKRFCTHPDWIPPVVVTTKPDSAGAREVADAVFPQTVIRSYDPVPGYANLAAQSAMMHSDIYGQADIMWLVGSDCIACREFSPLPFMVGNKPRMLFNSYANLKMVGCPWQQGVFEALRYYPEFEFMRRLPIPYPRGLFGETRRKIEELHKMTFGPWLYTAKNRGLFSESNVLGAYAHKWRNDMFHWELLDNPNSPYLGSNGGHPLPLIQFWSHGGFDRVVDVGVSYPGGNSLGKTPRQVITDIMGGLV